MKKPILFLIVFLVLAVAGWFLWQPQKTQPSQPASIAQPVIVPEITEAVIRPVKAGGGQAHTVRVNLTIPAAMQDELLKIEPMPTKISISGVGLGVAGRLPYAIVPYSATEIIIRLEVGMPTDEVTLTFARAGAIKVQPAPAPTPAVVNLVFRAISDMPLQVTHLPVRVKVAPWRFNSTSPIWARRVQMHAS